MQDTLNSPGTHFEKSDLKKLVGIVQVIEITTDEVKSDLIQEFLNNIDSVVHTYPPSQIEQTRRILKKWSWLIEAYEYGIRLNDPSHLLPTMFRLLVFTLEIRGIGPAWLERKSKSKLSLWFELPGQMVRGGTVLTLGIWIFLGRKLCVRRS